MKFTFLKTILASAAVGIAQTSAQDADACAMTVRMQDEGEDLTDWVVPGWHNESNIVVKIAPTDCGVVVSDTWTIAGWNMTIVQMGPDEVYTPPALGDDMRHAVKILRGTLIDVNYNGILKDGHWHTYAVTTPNRAIPLWIDSTTSDFTAGDDGAVITYWTVSEETLASTVTDMESGPPTDMAGPEIENLKWYNCGRDYGWGDFEGYEFWNFPGMLVTENDDSRLMYMQWWTFREDFDADGYHNDHPKFGEMHMTMYQGSPVTGMQTTLHNTENLNFIANHDPVPSDRLASYSQNDQTEVQIAMPMPPGFAHGPLWYVDPSTGEPTKNCAGNMVYPFHRMLHSDEGSDNSPLRYTLWIAFEHPPEDVTIPLEMLTEWPNANLQSTWTPEECEALSASNGTRTSVDATPKSETAADPLASGSASYFSALAWAISFAFMFLN